VIRLPSGAAMAMPNDIGWTTYARIVRKPGIGWVFIGYSEPKWGALSQAIRSLPSMQSLNEQNYLYFAEPGGQWERV